jgi:hypothetical protein
MSPQNLSHLREPAARTKLDRHPVVGYPSKHAIGLRHLIVVRRWTWTIQQLHQLPEDLALAHQRDSQGLGGTTQAVLIPASIADRV